MKQLHNVSSIKACIISPYTPPHVLNTPEPGVKFKISTMKIISIISRSSNESSTLFLAPLPTENINHNIINIIINYQLQSAVGDSGDRLRNHRSSHLHCLNIISLHGAGPLYIDQSWEVSTAVCGHHCSSTMLCFSGHRAVSLVSPVWGICSRSAGHWPETTDTGCSGGHK